MLKLYDFFTSGAAMRVRIALHLKQLDYETITVNLTKNGGEQFSSHYKSINPQGRVPTLIDSDAVLYQSLAIIEYLEEKYPQPPLLPQDRVERAKARAIAQIIACDIHPLNNMSVLKYLMGECKLNEDQKNIWYQHWTTLGFQTIEAILSNNPATSKCCFGDWPTLADIYLIPSIANARRLQYPMDNYPTMNRIFDYCSTLPAFIKARPENHPDVTR